MKKIAELKIDSYEDRKNVIMAAVNSGFAVRTEMKKVAKGDCLFTNIFIVIYEMM